MGLSPRGITGTGVQPPPLAGEALTSAATPTREDKGQGPAESRQPGWCLWGSGHLPRAWGWRSLLSGVGRGASGQR